MRIQLAPGRGPSTRPRLQENSCRPGGGTRKAAAAVELALVLPLLMLLVLGSADFGRFSHTAIAVSNASRSAAGLGAMQPVSPTSRTAWEAEIRQTARIEMEGVNGFQPDRMVVTIETASEDWGRQRVTVTVTYPFETLLTWVGIPSSFPLRHTTSVPMIR